MRLVKPSELDLSSYIPEDETQNVRPAKNYRDAVRKQFFDKALKNFPSALGMKDKIQFRPGELTIWAGQNGHFKSFVTGQVAIELMLQNKKVMISSLEMRPEKTIKRMITQASGCSMPTEAFVDAFMEFTDSKLWIHDQQGSVKPELMLAMLRYCADQFGCEHLFVDSLTKVIKREDDYNGQKEFLDQLCIFARDYQIHLHLVAHQKKPEMGEDKVGGKYDIKGASSISDLANNVIMVFRNKAKEQRGGDVTKADMLLNIVKQRDGDFEGPHFLWRDPESLQFRDNAESNPTQMVFEDGCPL
jgi:twinkle protein